MKKVSKIFSLFPLSRTLTPPLGVGVSTKCEKNMRIIEIEIEKLKPYEKNAKKHDKRQIDNVAESIKQFGWRQPIVCDQNNVIIIGHCRLLAAKKLKLKTVPVHYAEDLTDEQIKKLRNLDNKLNESEWDWELLKDDISDLEFDGFDVDWGFEEEQEKKTIVEDDVPEIDETSPPTVKIGDIWKLGEHRLMCGDSTDKESVEKLMNGNQADLLVTDPPYNVAYEGKTKDALTIENDSMSGEDFRAFLKNAFERAVSSLKPGGDFMFGMPQKSTLILKQH